MKASSEEIKQEIEAIARDIKVEPADANHAAPINPSSPVPSSVPTVNPEAKISGQIPSAFQQVPTTPPLNPTSVSVPQSPPRVNQSESMLAKVASMQQSGTAFIPAISSQQANTVTAKEVTTPQKEPAEITMPPDLLINTSFNEDYHEKILTLLKITNNKVLNSIYCKTVPQVNRNALLMFDLTLAPNVFFHPTLYLEP